MRSGVGAAADRQNSIMRNCVRVALLTLDQSVRVRILLPQPKRTLVRPVFFFIFPEEGDASLLLSTATW